MTLCPLARHSFLFHLSFLISKMKIMITYNSYLPRCVLVWKQCLFGALGMFWARSCSEIRGLCSSQSNCVLEGSLPPAIGTPVLASLGHGLQLPAPFSRRTSFILNKRYKDSPGKMDGVMRGPRWAEVARA